MLDADAGRRVFRAALMAGPGHGEACNCGHGEPLGVIDLIEGVRQSVGRTDLALIVQSNVPNEIPAQWLDASTAQTRLGRTPPFTLRGGLERTTEWHREVLP